MDLLNLVLWAANNQRLTSDVHSRGSGRRDGVALSDGCSHTDVVWRGCCRRVRRLAATVIGVEAQAEVAAQIRPFGYAAAADTTAIGVVIGAVIPQPMHVVVAGDHAA